MSQDTVDIRPCLGDILDGYKRLSYRPETAIAEFVDNSTASYIQNKALLQLMNEKLRIDIRYSPTSGCLEVIDNAWGMDKQTFSDALTISKRPQVITGRNEFGMGLKTAASWFGQKWKVITKRTDSNEEYSATINVQQLKQSKKNTIDIITRHVNDNSHYTIIQIFDLNRKIYEKNIGKIQRELSSIYRRDINSGEISIYVNDTLLQYEIPSVLTEIIDGEELVWKRDFNSSIQHNGITYPFDGFVALRSVGNYRETGFALLRRGRVIVGGTEKNFKPIEIFGSANSFQSLRIFGEVNLDNWPVTQAKDAFDWDLDGLKEKFIEKLAYLVKDYVDKAKTARKKDVETSTQVSIEEVKDIADETVEDINKIPDVETGGTEEIKTYANTNDNDVLIPSYQTTISILGQQYDVEVDFINDIDKELFTLDDTDASLLKITFNSAYPYFNVVNSQKEFTKVFQKYLILQIIAEKYLAKVSTHKGLVYPFEVRETINRMLAEIVKQSKTLI